jgi:hypothetical protein
VNSRNMRGKVGDPSLQVRYFDIRKGAFERGLKGVPAVAAIGIVGVNASDGLIWKMLGGEDTPPWLRLRCRRCGSSTVAWAWFLRRLLGRRIPQPAHFSSSAIGWARPTAWRSRQR